MKIETVSKPHFMMSAKKALFQNCMPYNKDKLTSTSSFRYVHDLTSLDIAETTIALEEEYDLDLDFVVPNDVDNLTDLYEMYLIGVKNKNDKEKPDYIYQYMLSVDNVFYALSTILMMNHKLQPKQITKNSRIIMDLKLNWVDIANILKELEKRYHYAIPAAYKAEDANTLWEFAQICSNALNQKIALCDKVSAQNVVKHARNIIADEKFLLAKNISATSRLGWNLHMDDLDKMQLIMDLEKIYRVSISESIIYSKVKNLGEFCMLCANEINKKIPLNNIENKNVSYLPEPMGLMGRIKNTYQRIRGK